MPTPKTPMNSPVAPNMQNQAKGSFGYLQNPVMSGAGMPRAMPMQAQGTPYRPAPMFEPRSVKPLPSQANPMARSKARGL